MLFLGEPISFGGHTAHWFHLSFMEKSMHKKILIAEDHPLFRSALKATLAKMFTTATFLEVDSIDVLQRVMEKELKPDLVLLDLNMPGAHGFSGLYFVRGHYPDCPVVVISTHEEVPVIVKAHQLGAMAYIPKSVHPSTLHEALSKVEAGKMWYPPFVTHFLNKKNEKYQMNNTEKGIASLTPQQFRILGMMGEGQLNKQIAYELSIAEATVKAHVTAVFKKLHVGNRTQAVIALNQLELNAHMLKDDGYGASIPSSPSP